MLFIHTIPSNIIGPFHHGFGYQTEFCGCGFSSLTAVFSIAIFAFSVFLRSGCITSDSSAALHVEGVVECHA